MATIENNTSSSAGMLIGFIALIVVLVTLFFYGIPAMRSNTTPNSIIINPPAINYPDNSTT